MGLIVNIIVSSAINELLELYHLCRFKRWVKVPQLSEVAAVMTVSVLLEVDCTQALLKTLLAVLIPPVNRWLPSLVKGSLCQYWWPFKRNWNLSCLTFSFVSKLNLRVLKPNLLDLLLVDLIWIREHLKPDMLIISRDKSDI